MYIEDRLMLIATYGLAATWGAIGVAAVAWMGGEMKKISDGPSQWDGVCLHGGNKVHGVAEAYGKRPPSGQIVITTFNGKKVGINADYCVFEMR